jgi:5'-nucleotidase / UDP-sugar diphosphatase
MYRFFIPLLIMTVIAIAPAVNAKPGAIPEKKQAIERHIVLLYVNDEHGNLMPFHDEKGRSIGGISRIATVVDPIRKSNDFVLLLNAGDILSRGDAMTIYFGGDLNFHFMDLIGFDALTPGNGDFYFGVKNLQRLASQVHFPIIDASVRKAGKDTTIFTPYIIKEFGRIRVAILGLGTIHTGLPSAHNLRLQDPFETVAFYGPMLRKKSDLVIALTHLGVIVDAAIADSFPYFDFIVGGHSHTAIDTSLRIRHGNHETVVVQAGDLHHYLGRTDIYLRRSIDSRYHIRSSSSLLEMDSSVSQSQFFVDTLEQVARFLKTPVARLTAEAKSSPQGQSSLGNLVTSAMIEASGATVALLNRDAVQGSLRGPLISREDVCRVLPWRNAILIDTLSGSLIDTIVKHSHALYYAPDGKTKDSLPSLTPENRYVTAISDNLTGSEHRLKRKHQTETGIIINDAFMNYLMKHYTLNR